MMLKNIRKIGITKVGGGVYADKIFFEINTEVVVKIFEIKAKMKLVFRDFIFSDPPHRENKNYEMYQKLNTNN